MTDRGPYALELKPGTYYWCACGQSKNQPFCDGSHKGSNMQPTSFEVKKLQTFWLCGCKASKRPPWCDGSHSALEAKKKRAT